MKSIKYVASVLAVLALVWLSGCATEAPAPPSPSSSPPPPSALEATGSVTLDIEFNTAKWYIKPKYNDEIKQVADFMKAHPETKVVIEGHTDSVGSKASNIKLSQQRAESVKAYLVNRFGVEGSRLRAVGYGPDRPIASNDTAEGRQKNRRVEAVVEKTAQ
jgi:OmpA-OmpF porin, OOP family